MVNFFFLGGGGGFDVVTWGGGGMLYYCGELFFLFSYLVSPGFYGGWS